MHQNRTTRPFEALLISLGAVYCLIVTILIWRSVSAYQNMWPFPGLYFMEMVLASLLGAFAFIRGFAASLTWGAAGILSAFSLAGAMSVGFFYLPVALIFAALSTATDLRGKRPIMAHLGIFLIAGLAQTALILVAIQLFK
jgi:hypothetical protein